MSGTATLTIDTESDYADEVAILAAEEGGCWFGASGPELYAAFYREGAYVRVEIGTEKLPGTSRLVPTVTDALRICRRLAAQHDRRRRGRRASSIG